MPYTPPLTITPRLIDPISRISLALGCWEGAAAGLSPNLRRKNHIRSIHALLAVENRFILEALLESLHHAKTSDPVSRLIAVLLPGESLSIQTMMERFVLRHRTYFRRTFLNPALKEGKVGIIEPDYPHSPKQRPCLITRNK